MSTQLTENFTREELACRCGCGCMEFSRAAVWKLQELRDEYGWPMRISSGYRCPKHNAEVSDTGAAGPHTITEGDSIAVDVLVYGARAHELLACALRLGWRGIGVKQKGPRDGRFLHLDRVADDAHPRPWVWSY